MNLSQIVLRYVGRNAPVSLASIHAHVKEVTSPITPFSHTKKAVHDLLVDDILMFADDTETSVVLFEPPNPTPPMPTTWTNLPRNDATAVVARIVHLDLPRHRITLQFSVLPHDHSLYLFYLNDGNAVSQTFAMSDVWLPREGLQSPWLGAMLKLLRLNQAEIDAVSNEVNRLYFADDEEKPHPLLDKYPEA